MANAPIQNLSLSLIFAGFKHVERWWNFKNVVSPFYRLYYVTDGKGRVTVDSRSYELEKGQLFLIPKFACHSYECDEHMDHYYFCFFDDLTQGSGIPLPDRMRLQVRAQEYDAALVRRYLELNPHKELRHVDPKRYNAEIYDEKQTVVQSVGDYVESEGILKLLFARFITEECMGRYKGHRLPDKLDEAINHISLHLNRPITVAELARKCCLSTDHFSKVFNQTMGCSPCRYIQMKRIKRAQALLLTTGLSITRVAEEVGIYSPSQFSRLFVKIAHCTPKQYKQQQWEGLSE